MNEDLRYRLEYLRDCDDKAITPDVKDDIEWTLEYIDKLEKELEDIKECRTDKTKDSVYMKMSKENLVKVIGIKNSAIAYIKKDVEERLERMGSIGKTIENPEEVFIDRISSWGFTLMGGVFDLSKIPTQEDGIEYPSFISLKDIEDHIDSPCYTIIYEEPLGGTIYRYNNYGNGEWTVVGVMYGFA